MTVIKLCVNGTWHELDVPPRLLLVDLLRERLGLTGTKIGCGTGVCGSCTVLIGGESRRACLTLAVQASRCDVRTVEGLATGGTLNRLQETLHQHHALQCGFCTPGVLMALTPLIEAGEPLDEETARQAIAGNLCRCTGYDTIVQAAVEASHR
jgi:aerobic-type carbon monoxide dehydrogenase small subunit (CoxS/CutS family)